MGKWKDQSNSVKAKSWRLDWTGSEHGRSRGLFWLVPILSVPREDISEPVTGLWASID